VASMSVPDKIWRREVIYGDDNFFGKFKSTSVLAWFVHSVG
jgi:hypothetical protein